MGAYISNQLPLNEREFQENGHKKRRSTFKRVSRKVLKRTVTPISRRYKPKTDNNGNHGIQDIHIMTMQEQLDSVITTIEGNMPLHPMEYTSRMTNAAGMELDESDDELFVDSEEDDFSQSQPSDFNFDAARPASMYVDLLCDNLGTLPDVCDCNELGCFICRKRADDDLKKNGKSCVIYIDEDYSDVKKSDPRYLREGGTVKPFWSCFSI